MLLFYELMFFRKNLNVSTTDIDTYCLFRMSLAGFTWQCGLKDTDFGRENRQDYEITLLLEKNIRGGISSVMGDRYVRSDDKKKFCILMLIVFVVMLWVNPEFMRQLNLMRMVN